MDAVKEADPNKCSMVETVRLTLGILHCTPRDEMFAFHDDLITSGKKGIFDSVDQELRELDMYNTLASPADSIFIFLSHSWTTPEDWPQTLHFENVKLDQLFSSSQDLKRDHSVTSRGTLTSNAAKDTLIWLDKASSPQWGEAYEAVKKFDFFFMQYIALSENMLVLAVPSYFTRLWCVFEIASFLALHPPGRLYIGIDAFLNDRDAVMDNGVPAEEATIYRIQDFINPILELSIDKLQCKVEEDRKILLKLIHQNFGQVEQFEYFSKICIFAIIAHNMSISVEFMTNNQHEDPNQELYNVYVKAFAVVKKASRNVSVALYKCLSKLEQGEYKDTQTGNSPAMTSFHEHLEPFLNNLKDEALVTGNPLTEYAKAVQIVQEAGSR